MNYFVTAIHTDSGKTLVSAILCEALRADYWKPIQAGAPYDADTVRSLIAPSLTLHPSAHVLKMPASPHAAAAAEGITISLNDINAPSTEKDLVIEGAGGCLVPLNDTDFVIDMATRFKAQLILVSNHYLGSINHTLLTFEALQKRGLMIKGIIFNGAENPETERIILHHTRLRCLLRIKPENHIDHNIVSQYAAKLIANWYE
jgi:dethiobiotin synthetase